MRRVLIAIVLLMSGCKAKASSKEEPKTAAPVDAAAPKPVEVPPDAPAPKPAATTSILCDQILPPEVLAKFYPNMTMKETLAPQLPGGMCELSHDYEFAMVAVTCLDPQITAATMDFGVKQMEEVQELKVGKRAYVGKSMGMVTMNLWDGDSDCVATIGGFQGDATEMAKAIEAGLTAETAEKLRAHANERAEQPKSETAICDALLSEAARAAHYPGATVHESDAFSMGTVSCELPAGANMGSVNVSCDPSSKMAINALKGMIDGVVDLQVGKSAHAGTMQGKTVMNVLTERDCIITATGFSGDAADLGRALDAALTPEVAARFHGP